MCSRRQCPNGIVNRARHLSLGTESGLVSRQFRFGRQMAVNEQERGLFVGSLLGEIVDVIAAILQTTAITVDFTDSGNACWYAF